MVIDNIRKYVEPYKTNVAWALFILCFVYSLFNLFTINSIYNNELRVQLDMVKPSPQFDLGLGVDGKSYHIEDKSHEVTYRLISMMYSLFVGGMIYARNLTK